MRSIYLFLALFLFGCSTSHRVAKQSPPEVSQLSNHQQQKTEVITRPRDFTEAPAERYYSKNTEGMLSLELDEITVYSTSRVLPERNGVVSIDFTVTLPKELIGNTRSVIVRPTLHLEKEKRRLSEIVIRGALFDRVQHRNYWQYEKYVRTFTPDAKGKNWAYDRFIRNPIPSDVRLDSVITRADRLVFYYRQEIPADETTKTMRITLETFVKGLDGTSVGVAALDTLKFNISSLLSFVDTEPRYIKKVIERKVTVSDRRYITFGVNRSEVDADLGTNRAELLAVENIFTGLLQNGEFEIEAVEITAGCSPEGSSHRNAQLSERRAQALKDYLGGIFGNSLDELLTVRSIGENWPALEQMIREDTARLESKECIFNIIEATADLDRRELSIRQRYPRDYKIIRDEFYPRLRAVEFTFNLARKGMEQDTIISTEVDTAYMEALELLRQRKYPEALCVLQAYNDLNTAVCYLSMGYDRSALDVLALLPESDIQTYLTAVTASRLGYLSQAREWFHKAVELNPQLKYRARLDPEISELLYP